MRRSSRFKAPSWTTLALVASGLSVALAALPAQARPRTQISASNAFETPDPLLIVVSLRRQRLTVFNSSGVVTESPVSSGQPEFPTPTGVFSIIGKEVEHESNIYEGAAMPFMQRLTWTGTALHAGNLPGYAASHGCIRLPWSFSKRLFDMTQINTRVIVTKDDPTPLAFSHPRLFAPTIDAPPASEMSMVNALPSRVASLSLVTPAMAAPAELPSNRLPPTAKAKARQAETARMFDAIKSAEAERANVWEAVKSANRSVEAAKEERADVDQTMSVKTGELAKLERAKKGGETQIASFMRKAQNARTDAQLDALAQAEEAAEAKLLDVMARRDKAVEAVVTLQASIPALEAKLANAETARRALDDQLKAANLAVKNAQLSYNVAKREDARSAKPVSVLISRKDQRMYVRQGFETVLEAPIVIENADQPMGTHVFTAMGVKNGRTLDWTVVSLTSPLSGNLVLRADDKRRAKVKSDPTAVAARALERVSFPPEAIAAVSEVIKPGSSVIVSDETNSQYFGAGTDLSVLVH